jgi:hypothetical protein
MMTLRIEMKKLLCTSLMKTKRSGTKIHEEIFSLSANKMLVERDNKRKSQ